MAVYGTDLFTMTDAESGTWTEFTPYSNGGSPGADGENFIQGQDCQSQTFGVKTGLVFSIVYDAGSDISSSFATGDVVQMWHECLVPEAIETYANGGMRLGIGSSVSAINSYAVGGRDFARNPYGGWQNSAVDPTLSADYTDGGGNGGAYRYFGSILYTIAQISKGSPHAVDAIRRGRGELYCYNTGADFAGMAAANDVNLLAAFTGDTTSASPVITNISNTELAVIGMEISGTNLPTGAKIISVNEGASSIQIDTLATGTATGTSFSAFNRLGLFQDQFGSYLWKGLISFGRSGNSVTFSDANKSIVIDDTPKTYAAFNRMEVNVAGSSVTWTNITIKALGTLARGEFEMIDNATVNWTGCLFIDMSTFVFLSNATLAGNTWLNCGQITHGGADFNRCVFQGYEGTANTSYLLYNIAADPDGELDECTFEKGTAATHAIEFGTTSPTTMTLRGVDFVGYSASNNVNDSTFHVKRTAGTVTINLIDCTGNFSYRTDGATVVIVPNPRTHSLTGVKLNSEVTYTARGTAVDTGSDGSSTANSRNFVTTNAWTTDAYKGHLLYITSGADAGRYYVTGNNATTLFLDAELSATASSLTWELYDENDDTIEFHVENVTATGLTEYEYTYSAGYYVDIMIQHVSYEEIVILDVLLPDADASIPIDQRLDSNYFNP